MQQMLDCFRMDILHLERQMGRVFVYRNNGIYSVDQGTYNQGSCLLLLSHVRKTREVVRVRIKERREGGCFFILFYLHKRTRLSLIQDQ